MTIRAELADGRVLEFPDGTDPSVIQTTVKRMISESPVQTGGAPQEGITAALTGGFKRFLSTGETAAESLINPELAAQRGVERSRQIGEQYAPGASLEKVKQAYESEGLFPAIKEGISQIPAALAEQAPQIAATLGSARLGAMAGSPLGPVGAVVGGVAGAVAPSLVQLYGSNLERQAEEKAPISRAGAFGAAVPGAALEVASTFIPLGRGLVGKLLGPKADEFLRKGSEEAIERAARESLTTSLTKGAGVGALAEIPTEVAQQMLERYQAGLSLTDEQALKEYGEAAYGAGLVGGPFGAAARGLGRPGARAEFERQQQEEAQRLAVSDEELAQRFPDILPGGFKIEEQELGREMAPAGYSILAEGREEPLSVVDTAEEAQAKLESLTQIREQERAKLLEEDQKIDADVQKAQARLEQLEATEQAGTEEYQTLKADLPRMMEESAQKKAELFDRVEKLGAPLSVTPIGEVERVNKQFNVVAPTGTVLQSYATLGEAEADVRKMFGEEAFDLKKKNIETARELYKNFVPQMRKFGLGDVGLNIVDRIENGAGGSYLNKLITTSLEEANPIQTMRHESLHAMKDLGFFTPQQWKALEERANKEWIKKYLEGQETEIDGQKMSRLEGYRKLGYSEQDIVEEAIADAFGDYDKGAKPPPGLIAALFRKIKNFFSSLGQALRGAGFQSAEDIFQNIERGKLKPAKETKPAAEEKLSLKRAAVEGEVEISTQNPTGPKRAYDPIAQMLSIDEKAVMEAMKSNPDYRKATIKALKSYGFIPEGVKGKDVIELFKSNIVDNLLYLYNLVPESIRKRSKLWYDGANKISEQMAEKYGLSLRQVSAIMAAMSPQKDWFQNVSMGERAIDILTKHGDRSWTPEMLQYAESYVKETKDRAEREKRQEDFDKIKKVAAKGTTLNEMDIKSAAAFIRAYDEAFHSRQYRIVTPEGGFGEIVTNNDGTPSTMMWSTYGPIEKAVSIFRDGSRENVSQQLGFEHKIRSFYNNIAAPNSDLEHVTIDTHAVAAALFEALAGTDPEVVQNFGGTGKTSITGVGGTYGLIADAYREAARKVGVLPREMQSITWEAVRGLFNEDIKSSIKEPVKAEWAKYKSGDQSFEQTRQNIIEISRNKRTNDKGVDIPPPDWVGSGKGEFVEDGGESYDKSYVPTGGVRLREEKEIRDKLTFNLSAVTGSIPGLRELYDRALKRDEKAGTVLQEVADASLTHLLSGTNAKVAVTRAKGVYLSDREPSLMVAASFNESEGKDVLAALARFAKNFNQEQIHVRMPTKKKAGFEYGDGSYTTNVFTIPLKKELNDKAISDIIDKSGLKGFTVTNDSLITYFVRPNKDQGESNEQYAKRIDQEFKVFEEQVASAHVLAGRPGTKVGRKIERLFVYGSGYGAAIDYESILGDVRPKQGADTVTPRLIAEYLTGKPVQVFKQKDLTKAQIAQQEKLARTFDSLPVNDLKNPMVKKAYKALTKALKEQFAVLPIKVELQTEKDSDGNIVPPYNNNSAAMRKDILERNHMLVYPTTPETFGPEGYDFSGHPLLEDSGFKDINGEPMLFNDVLRAVHDYFAHGMSEAQFGPKGEFTAWRNHMASTPDPMARWALTAETRMQNAWQNFSEGAQKVPLKDRPFALQKAALPPTEFLYTGDNSVDLPVYQMEQELSDKQKRGSEPTAKFSLKNVRFPTVKEAKEAVKAAGTPNTEAFKLFNAGNQWVDADGKPKVFYHATARDFFEFTPAGQSQAIFLAETPEEAETFGSIAEDKLRREVYSALGLKEDKLKFLQGVVDRAVEKGTITKKEGDDFMKQANRKTPAYGDFGDIEQDVYDALIELSPTRMSIMPLYARAMTPFDFENKEHVDQVMNWVANNTQYPQDFPEKWLNGMKGRISQGLWQAIEDKRVQQAIRALGFDAFTVRENRASAKNYAVYKPNQVKSVTGNLGDFSLESKDIRYSLPTLSADTMKRINEVTPGRYEPGWKERVIGGFKQDYTSLRQKFLNRYEALAVLDRRLREQMKRSGGPELLADQSAEFAALQSDLAAGVTASAMGIGDRQGGIPVYKNGFTTIDTSVKGLTEALAPLAKYGDPEVYRAYQFWAGWKRGRRLLREGREQVYTPDDAKRAQEIEDKYPVFVQVQKDLVAFNNGIVNYAVQTGVLSRERAQVYTKYADYIPFYRQLDLDKTIGPNPFSGISGLRGPKELKGGEAPLGDFMENLVRNTQSMINAGMKNAAAQKATKVALQLKEVERLPGPAKGVGYDVYTQLENGELVYYRSADPLFIDALKSLNMPDLPFMGLLSAPANVLRNLVTKDPGFMMANLLRDSLSSYVTSGQNVTPIVGTMVNFGKALSGKDKNLQALFNAGVIGGYEFSQNVEQSGKSLSADLNKKAGKDAILLRPFKSLWEGLEKGTTASDAATRMAVYERVMKETGNEAEAISRALEVMNFSRKGNSILIRIATAAIPFFNARLQGLDLFYRASTGRMDTQDAKEIKRKFWIRGMTMAALSVMYYMSVAGDDEYEKQEEETKDNNWIFPSLGIRVPIPFEVGTLFKTMPERITAYLMGNDTGKELKDSTLRALGNTFAFNPIPQTFKPIIEVATNYNFFTMRPIVGQGMQDVAPQFQVGPGTSKTAEYLGGVLNVSPLKLDQLIKGYTGTIGGYVTDVVDAMASEFSDVPKASKRFEQMPIVKRFALDPEARGSVTQFYELQKSVDTFVRTANLLEKTARPEEYAKYVQENLDMLAAKDYISGVEKGMKELREMKRMINTLDIPPDEKRDLLVDLGRAENNLTANTKTIKKAFSELK